ncbi:hypothetical protein AB1Y20_002509 [Prymnesium parvum]|uniref:Uncharacterized protein n=1 Tax=Prymnesium parvum TaxID=97485 RepID=A0AB34JBV7_PRYPA
MRKARRYLRRGARRRLSRGRSAVAGASGDSDAVEERRAVAELVRAPVADLLPLPPAVKGEPRRALQLRAWVALRFVPAGGKAALQGWRVPRGVRGRAAHAGGPEREELRPRGHRGAQDEEGARPEEAERHSAN